jgi:hypothetical protein
MRTFDLKIENREQALKVTRDSGLGFLALAAIQALFGIFLIPTALLDAALYAILAGALLLLKSRIVAICLLLLSIATLVTTFLNRLGMLESGGRNIALSLVVVYLGARAVQATFALHAPAQHVSVPQNADPGNPLAAKPPPKTATSRLERYLLIAVALLIGLVAMFAVLLLRA